MAGDKVWCINPAELRESQWPLVDWFSKSEYERYLEELNE